MKKSIAYTLAHTLPEVAAAMVFVILSYPLPTTSILILCIDLLTELLPAMSLAYENPEDNIMDLVPRDVTVDRLISMPLLGYVYFQAGLIITLCCFYAYFMGFDYFGISSQEVTQFNGRYFGDYPIGVYISDKGEAFTVDRQMQIMKVIHATYYLAIVFCQATHIWTCRTMVVSIFEHGIFTNQATNYGVPISIALGLLVVYFPPLMYVDGSGGALILIVLQATAIAFVSLWIFTEGRKYIIRTYPDSTAKQILNW